MDKILLEGLIKDIHKYRDLAFDAKINQRSYDLKRYRYTLNLLLKLYNEERRNYGGAINYTLSIKI